MLSIRKITIISIVVLIFVTASGCRNENAPLEDKGKHYSLSYCTPCHGSDANPAPPRDLYGNTDTSARGVGAHQSHLNESSISKAIGCDECHIVPVLPSDPGHMDTNLPAEVIFGTLASTGGLIPSWDGTKCSSVYCHGAGIGDSADKEPVWTFVGNSQAACKTSCHEAPPNEPQHPSSAKCGICHRPTVDASCDFDIADCTISNKETHINGVVDGNFACNSCHGNSTNAAPPVDTNGNSSTSLTSVGAHQKHLTTGEYRVAISCDECHKVPANVTDTGHIDSSLPAEVIFGALARTEGLNPTWDGIKCTNVYCHGVSISGTAITDPTWTVVDGTQTACGTGCHQTPSFGHPHDITNCGDCHQPTVDPSCDVSIAPCAISDKTTHINGKVELNE